MQNTLKFCIRSTIFLLQLNMICRNNNKLNLCNTTNFQKVFPHKWLEILSIVHRYLRTFQHKMLVFFTWKIYMKEKKNMWKFVCNKMIWNEHVYERVLWYVFDTKWRCGELATLGNEIWILPLWQTSISKRQDFFST
jgi:hypothetical protein